MLEHGIEEDVARDAHELLDGWLGPQEGGALLEVFDPASTANSGAVASGSRTEMDVDEDEGEEVMAEMEGG